MDGDYTGNLGFITVLFPFRDAAPDVSVRPLGMASRVRYRAEALEVTTPTGRDTFVLNPEQLPGVRWRGKPVTCRARVKLSGERKVVEVP